MQLIRASDLDYRALGLENYGRPGMISYLWLPSLDFHCYDTRCYLSLSFSQYLLLHG
jgi:hypothetical protein